MFRAVTVIMMPSELPFFILKELELNFNRISENNFQLQKEKGELAAQLGAHTAEKTALETELASLKTIANKSAHDLKQAKVSRWLDRYNVKQLIVVVLKHQNLYLKCCLQQVSMKVKLSCTVQNIQHDYFFKHYLFSLPICDQWWNKNPDLLLKVLILGYKLKPCIENVQKLIKRPL